jgi:hypothetical protein
MRPSSLAIIDPSELPLELDLELADVPDALIRKLRIRIRASTTRSDP